MHHSPRYHVSITRSLAQPDGTTIFGDLGVDRLETAGISWEVQEQAVDELSAEQLSGADAIIVMGPERVTRESLPRDGRLRHLARYGVGYDAIDVDACSDAGIVVTNTPDSVRVPMAHAALALLFASAHNLVVKDRLVREGRWHDRVRWHGPGLPGRRVGIVGFGGIGSETARLVGLLGIETVVWNRSDRAEAIAASGARQVPLDELLTTSDFVIVAVAGAPGTRRLIGERELGLMKPTARLINISRGSVVDEAALVRALEESRLGGAALDVFEQEPVAPDSPLLQREDVIVAPHALGWTESFARAGSRSVIDAVLAVARGERPEHVVNPDALPAALREDERARSAR